MVFKTWAHFLEVLWASLVNWYPYYLPRDCLQSFTSVKIAKVLKWCLLISQQLAG